MPIVGRVSVDAPLDQGDVLKGISVAYAGTDGKAHIDPSVRFVLVLSRPCNACRDKLITVAPVSSYKLDLTPAPPRVATEARDLDWMRRKLLMVGEGGAFREEFYLGALDDSGSERFAAKLTTLATIEVPEDPRTRAAFIKDHRVWRLQPDFLHDLHFRQFAAYARLGFDDHAWFGDEDLAMMITAGELELAEVQKAFNEAEQTLQAQMAGGKKPAEKQIEALDARRRGLDLMRAKLQPYLDERAKRAARVGTS